MHRRKDRHSAAWLCRRTSENADRRSPFALFWCWMNSIPCLLSLHFCYKSLQSEHLMSVCVTRRSGRHRPRPGKETTKEDSSWDTDSSQTRTVLLRWVKATLILDTFVPFPPWTPLILTRHLNKEVRAMIVSLSEPSCSPNVGDSTLCDQHVIFLLLHRRRWGSWIAVGQVWGHPASVTFLQVDGTSLYSPLTLLQLWLYLLKPVAIFISSSNHQC